MHLKSKSFKDLQIMIGCPEVIERTGARGDSYQIEVEVFPDSPDERDGSLRIIASIDDGRFLAALLPLSADFIMEPDG